MPEPGEPKKSSYNLDILGEHVRQIQFALIAIALTLLLVSLVKPNASEEAEQLKLFEKVVSTFPNQWLDLELRKAKPEDIEFEPDYAIEGSQYRSPKGYILGRNIEDNWLKKAPDTFRPLFDNGAYSIFSGKVKDRGLPPYMLDSDVIEHSVDQRFRLPTFDGVPDSVPMSDIRQVILLLSEKLNVRFIKKVEAIYVVDPVGDFHINLKDARLYPVVREIEAKPFVGLGSGATVSTYNVIGKWNVSKKNEISWADTKTELIESDDKKVFFVVSVSEKTIDIGRVVARAAKEFGVRFWESPQDKFGLLVDEAKNDPDISLRDFKKYLRKFEKDPGRSVNAVILGISISGWTVWWLVPIALMAAQIYFVVNLKALFNSFKAAGSMTFPLGLLFVGKWESFFVYLAIVGFPVAAISLNFINVLDVVYPNSLTIGVNLLVLIFQTLNIWLLNIYLVEFRKMVRAKHT